MRVALDDDEGPILRDASVRVRAKALPGESYLDVNPGTAAAADSCAASTSLVANPYRAADVAVIRRA